MKPGDLVKMKFDMWWKLKSRKNYIDPPVLVISRDQGAIKVLLPSGKIKNSLAENWDVVSEN